MTGRYAHHTGLQHAYIMPATAVALPLELRTMADHLKEAGYATHMVGKWHLGLTSWEHTPLERGFDSFYGYLNGEEDYYTHTTWADGVVDLRDGCDIVRDKNGTYSSKMFMDRAISILKEHDKSNPLFLYLALQSVHAPRQTPPGWENAYTEIDDKVQRVMARMVSAMDESIGLVVDALKEVGMWEDTLLFFASDNGGPTFEGNSNFPLRGGKWTMWQGGVHVPAFIVHGTRGILARGTEFPYLGHHMDVLPTLLGAAGVSPEGKGFDGKNLWPYFTGRQDWKELEARMLVLNVDQAYPELGEEPEWSGYAGIHNLHWKLVLGHPGFPDGVCWAPQGNESMRGLGVCDESNLRRAPELQDRTKPYLFNLKEDPSELYNLASEKPEIVASMQELLNPHINSAVTPLNLLKSQRTRSPKAEEVMKANNAVTPWEPCKKECRCPGPR